MEVIGKIKQIVEQKGQSANGNEWTKIQVIIPQKEDTDFGYDLAIEFFGKYIPEDGFVKGAVYKIQCDTKSKEYNGKWYTSCSGWKAEIDSAYANQKQAPKQQSQPQAAPVQPTVAESDDNLPF